MSDEGQKKPQIGTVAPVEVEPVWKHLTVIVSTIIAVIPLVIAMLTQFQQLPGLPTNVMAWIAAAISLLTTVLVVYQKLFGKPQITPTAASKLIQTEPMEKK